MTMPEVATGAGAGATMGAAAGAMQELVAAAEAGRFSVSPQAADRLIKALQNMQNDLAAQRWNLRLIGRKTPLGTSEIGLAIGEKNSLMAAGGEGSLEAAHRQLEALVPRLIQALEASTAHYQVSDEGSATGITGAGR